MRISFKLIMFALVLGFTPAACDSGPQTSLGASLSVTEAQTQADELRAQKTSIFNIYSLSKLIEHHKLEHGQTPSKLEDLAPYLTSDGLYEFMHDGWGRGIFYYSNSADYTLICFGHDAIPAHENNASPGGYSRHLDFDADIIMINGNWAQTPEGLDRPF